MKTGNIINTTIKESSIKNGVLVSLFNEDEKFTRYLIFNNDVGYTNAVYINGKRYTHWYTITTLSPDTKVVDTVPLSKLTKTKENFFTYKFSEENNIEVTFNGLEAIVESGLSMGSLWGMISSVNSKHLYPKVKLFPLGSDKEEEVSVINNRFYVLNGVKISQHLMADKPLTPIDTRYIDTKCIKISSVDKNNHIVNTAYQDCMDYVKTTNHKYFDIYFNKELCIYNEEFIKNYINIINTLGFSQLEYIGIEDSINEMCRENTFHLNFGKQYHIRLHSHEKYKYFNYVSIILLRYLYWEKFQKFPEFIINKYNETKNLWQSIITANHHFGNIHNWSLLYNDEYCNYSLSLKEYKERVADYKKENSSKTFQDLFKKY